MDELLQRIKEITLELPDTNQELSNEGIALELPDPGQELSIQQLQLFPRFQDLPLEMRLMIWRYLLPKGHRIWLARKKNIRGRSQPLKMPIGLWINEESRIETYKHYKMLHKTVTPTPTTGSALSTSSNPIICCVDQAVDTLVIQDHCMGERYSSRATWLCELIQENAQSLSLVKEIEIKVARADLTFLYCSVEYNQEYVAMALCLSALECVTFVGPAGSSPYLFLGSAAATWQNLLRRSYTIRMECFEKGFKVAGKVVPTLVVRDTAGEEWQRHQTTS